MGDKAQHPHVLYHRPSHAQLSTGVSRTQISDNQDSLDVDPQEHSFTRTIDEEAELEERADRERDEGHQDQDEEEEDREHEVMTAGSKFVLGRPH